MPKVNFMIFVVIFVLMSCMGPAPTPVIGLVTDTPTATSRPVILVTPTLAPLPTATSTLTPPPPVASHWRCAPDGGLTCFGGFSYIDILNEQEGWAYGSRGIVLHYTTPPGETAPTWQPAAYLEDSLIALSMVSPTEGWGIIGRRIYHFKDGDWENAQVPGLMNDIFMLNEQEGWAVGEDGVILHYRRGKWQVVSSPTDTRLNSIAMLNEKEGWAVGVGTHGGVLHYRDGQWELATNNFYEEFHDIEFVSEDEGWVVGGAILHYQKGDWQEVITLDIRKKLYDISVVDANEAWAVGMNGTIYHYKDGQWQEVDSPTDKYLYSIDMVNSTEGWAVGSQETMLHYQNGSWSIETEGTLSTPHLHDVAGLEDGTSWAVGDRILYYNGKTWQPISSPVDDPDLNLMLFAVDMVSPEEGWAVGREANTEEGKLLHYHQGQWQLVPSSTVRNLDDIDMVNEHEGWAVGWDTGILHYTNGEWKLVMSADFSRPVAIDMVNPTEGWAVDLDGAFLHYQDGSWVQTPPIIDDSVSMSDIDMGDEQNGWAVGNHVFRYQDGKWHQVDDPPVGLITVAALSADEVWASGEGKIVHYQSGQWQIVDRPGSFSIRSIKMLNENEGWAVGDGILHYTNK